MRAKSKHFLFNNGARVILNPNGAPNTIWIQDERGHSISIQPSVGPHGMGLQVTHAVGTAPLTVGGNLNGSYEPRHCGDFAHLEITQYGHDEAAQNFKRRYARGKI